MVFWDAETWMFPALLATRSELARPVLDYRFRSRAAAAENARTYSADGRDWHAGRVAAARFVQVAVRGTTTLAELEMRAG